MKHFQNFQNFKEHRDRKYGDEMVTEQKLKLLLAVNLFRVSKFITRLLISLSVNV